MGNWLWNMFCNKLAPPPTPPPTPPPKLSTLPSTWIISGIVIVIVIILKRVFSEKKKTNLVTTNSVAVQCSINEVHLNKLSLIIPESKQLLKNVKVELKPFKFLTIGTVSCLPFYRCIVNTVELCKTASCSLIDDCKYFSTLGFDCEWNSFCRRERVALVQLTSYSGKCFLFRLNVLGHIPPPLAEILEDKDIIKVGVSPALDGKYLLQDYGVQVRSTLDLRHLYPEIKKGLKGLAKNVINLNLNKSSQISNWELPELSEEQKNYAALDVMAGIEIFKRWIVTQKMSRTNYYDVVDFLSERFDIDYNIWKQKNDKMIQQLFKALNDIK